MRSGEDIFGGVLTFGEVSGTLFPFVNRRENELCPIILN